MELWNVFFVLVLVVFPFYTGSNAAVFTLHNRCKETIWPGIQSSAGIPLLKNGGLMLQPNETTEVMAPTGWSGRFWGRNGCDFNESGKQGKCTTGDCGGVLECGGAGGVPPTSLAEFTLDSPEDFYDVSLVDGFNLPISIIPSGGTGKCSSVKCESDLNKICPQELVVKNSSSNSGVVACKSACLAFTRDEYCCTGKYNNPEICKPTTYSKVFKKACPTSYSYPYDDLTSTFTCKGANYLINYC